MNIPTEGRSILEQTSDMEKWHGFFSRVQFLLTFADRDHASLQLDGANIIPGSAARFQLEAIDASDFKKGYRLQTDGHYVSGENFHGNYLCTKTDTDPSKAKVFRPVFSSMQFSLKETASGTVLTRPSDHYNGKLYGRRATDLSLPRDSRYAGAQQLFEMPMWPIRQSKMSYISTDLHFNLAIGDKVLTAQDDSLILEAASDASSEAMLTATQPSSVHAGYILSVGGKYVKMADAGTPITLTDDASQAAHLCPIFDEHGRIAFWHGTSDHVLSVKDNHPVFTLLVDPSKPPPTWAMQPPTHTRTFHALSVEAETDVASLTDGGAIGKGTKAVPPTRLFEDFKREVPYEPAECTLIPKCIQMESTKPTRHIQSCQSYIGRQARVFHRISELLSLVSSNHVRVYLHG